MNQCQILLFISLCTLFLPVMGATESDKLHASDAAIGDWLGMSVSIDGNRVVAGAIYNGGNAGSAYLYERGAYGNWIETKLIASDAAPNDTYGFSVSIDADRIIIGSPADDDNGRFTGAAYIYERDANGNWNETKLVASDSVAGDYFGNSVSISGDRAIVGAYLDDDNINGINAGSVYVFERDAGGNWAETKLVASDAVASDYFGWSVAIDGDRAIVGAFLVDDNGDRSGAAYIYERNVNGNWVETKLTASDGASGDVFGRSVAIDGNLAIVGASLDDDNGSQSGSVYVFEHDGNGNWIETKLTSSDGDTEDYFGESVSIDGNRAIVGARQDDDNGSTSGSAYLYERNANGNWVETKMVASDGAVDDYFGWSVAIEGDRTIIGARLDDDNKVDSGSAYVFELEPQINTPAAGDILTDAGGTEKFTWTPQLADVIAWWLYVGSTPGSLNYHNSGGLNANTLTTTVSGLPNNANPIYARLWYQSQSSSTWHFTDTRYTAYGLRPTFTNPSAGTTLTGDAQTFVWQNNNTDTLQYWLYAGSSPGARDYFDSGNLGDALSADITGLPFNTSNVWIRLWFRSAGESWSYIDKQFTAANGPSISSSSGTRILSSPADTFTWTDPNGTVTSWWLYLGSSRGANDIEDSGYLADATSYTTSNSNLPTGSSSVHTRLWFREGLGSTWQFVDSVFTSVP